jgi:hypothetical protein
MYAASTFHEKSSVVPTTDAAMTRLDKLRVDTGTMISIVELCASMTALLVPTIGDCAFQVTASRVWNSLPHIVIVVVGPQKTCIRTSGVKP